MFEPIRESLRESCTDSQRVEVKTDAPKFEPLEERLLLSLLGIGVLIEPPDVYYDAQGALAYTAASESFTADAEPTGIALTAGSRPIRIYDPRDFQINLQVDNSGELIGGVAGDDLYVEGQIDVNRDGIMDYDGILLTGEIQAFGYLDSGGATDQYDFRFTPTGGDLMPFFEGNDIGVDMTSLNSTFTGSFAIDFSGLSQGVLGVIEKLAPPVSSLAGRAFIDANNNGVDEGEAGIGNVLVSLSGTDTDGNAVNLSAMTGVDGSFLFEDINPGTYDLGETQPGGYLDGTDIAGDAGGAVGNDLISGIALVGGEAATGYAFGELEAASISGLAYVDENNDGQVGAAEELLADVTVTLTGTDDLGNAVSLTMQTGVDGAFEFTDLRPGTYTISETQPADLLDGQMSVGDLGGAAVEGSDAIADIVVSSGDAGAGYRFGEILPGSLSGLVYVDFNDDGEVNFGETTIEGVTVTLTGVDDRGNTVSQTVQTDVDGDYVFTELRPGTYTIAEVQPVGYEDGQDALGTEGGTLTNDQAADIGLGVGTAGMNYNFGERPMATSEVTAGQTATIGFWRNKNGQALVKSVNDGPDSTQLGNWLAATYPKMYGVEAGENDLTGMTNSAVADFYMAVFRAKKGSQWWQLRHLGPAKLDAQVMALAFATYMTNQSLAGTVAADYGFTVTEYGIGAATFNIGDAGAAFGVADGTEMTVMDILLATNDQAIDGVLYDGDAILRSMANAVYTAINEAGDRSDLTAEEFLEWFRLTLENLLAQNLG